MIKRPLLLFLFALGFYHTNGQVNWTKVSESLVFDKPPFQSCHSSTLVETKNGELLIACFGGSHEGGKDVAIWMGKLRSDGHVIPAQAANGVINDTLRYPCWNPVLFKKKNGELVLFYKIGPNPREWWGVYKLSHDDGRTWSGAVRLPAGFLGPVKNKAIELNDGTILCPSSVELSNGRWLAHLEKTSESLKNWTFIPVDTAPKFDVIQPSILFYGGNKLQVLCRSKQGNVIQSWSADNGKTWSPLSKTSLLNPNSGTDAVTLKDGKQLIVYNPDVPGKEWYNGRANLRVAMSSDGEHWQDIMTLEHGTTEEYSYPAIIQTSDGLIHITYTYNRKNIKHVVIREE